MTHFQSANPPTHEEIENALLDFGFYHTFTQVSRMFAEYTNKGLLGYSGGVLEQPDEYWDDIATMQWLKLYVEHVAPMPRLEQISVFETLQKENRFGGNWITRHGNE